MAGWMRINQKYVKKALKKQNMVHNINPPFPWPYASSCQLRAQRYWHGP